jgi:protein O-GlcNAc transferase
MDQSFIAQCINTAHAANARHEFDTAIWWCKQAIQITPGLPEAWFNLGVALGGQGQRKEAIQALEKAQGLTLATADAQNSIGFQFMELEAYPQAKQCLERSIALAPAYAFPYVNLGKLCAKQERRDDAVAYFRRAIELQPDLAAAYINLGGVLNEQKNRTEAEAACLKAIELDPRSADAWNNLGLVLLGQKRHAAAEIASRKAIELDPRSADAWNNLGLVLLGQKRYASAEIAARNAIALNPTSFEAWSNQGSVLFGLDRFQEAANCFGQSLELNPVAPYMEGFALYMRLLCCDWRNFTDDLQKLTLKIQQGHKVVTPFMAMSLTSNPELQRKVAEIYVADNQPENTTLGPCQMNARNDSKIRIGYFSADFREHPVSQLMVEIFELHDRSRFELIGFSFGADTEDKVRKRVSAAFDRFVDVNEKSDAEVAALSRELGIDIAVNLGGHTEDARTGVFALRAAPVQVSYLGYPGTMGANYIDYLIADKTVCPERSQMYYTEKMAYLPHCFMPHDSTQEISAKLVTRQEFDLPEAGFVFCCFNNRYKINPGVFDAWMRLLRNVAGSVLWLSDGSQTVKDNLCKEAAARGIDPTRLVFARRLDSMAEHLARYRLADLFIDTLPFNAHTTACDALWAGVPVLTFPGESFASRVAASLLTAIDMPELITSNQADYEALAFGLATNPERLQQLKQKLNQNRLSTPLFDSTLVTKDLESAYIAIYERSLAGKPPEHIFVG